MTRASQKDDELETVERYLEITAIQGTAFKNTKSNEPPDIFVEQDGYRIGVEVTQYHAKERNVSGFTRREVEEAWKKIQEYVLDYASENTWLFDYDIFLRFKDNLVPNSKEKDDFVTEVASQVWNNKSQITDEDTSFLFNQSWPPILKKYLKGFSVCKTRCRKSWDAENFCFKLLGTSDEELCEIIKNKIPCRSSQTVQENWLIIYGGAELSTMFDVPWLGKIGSYVNFNSCLKTSNYDVVALFGFRTLLRWCRKNGWEKVQTE